MEWEEYKNKKKKIMSNYNYNLEETTIKCPKCGEFIYRDVSVVLASYPPQYKYICIKCDWQDTYF